MENNFYMEFQAISENESLARAVTSAFAAILDPTVEELAELKTAVSEAVTNAVVHAYPEAEGVVGLSGRINGNTIYITVSDTGIGIGDIALAKEPLYTGKPEEERSGLGFSIMESFCDSIDILSTIGEGTSVTLKKTFRSFQKEV